MIEVGYSTNKCPHYIEDGVEQEVTAVIGPLRIFEELKEDGTKRFEIVPGCSRYFYCENKKCSLSKVAREETQKVREVSH